MHIIEREVGGRPYRIAAQSVWNPVTKQPVSRQVVLGPAGPPPVVDLAKTSTVGARRLGDAGALLWVAEQLDLVGLIDRACAAQAHSQGPSAGELAVAVAVQRACSPSSKRKLAGFLAACLPRVSCLPADVFTGQAFHRAATKVSDADLERAQLAIAQAAVSRFDLSADVLAFDTTNFDTHIATTTPGELAPRTHAKSKRGDLRVVGLGVLVSETGHVPLLHRTYPANGSDQSVLDSCMEGLRLLHEELDAGEGRRRPAQRTIVRDGGSWSEQLELELNLYAGYSTVIALPLGHTASKEALEYAAKKGRMKPLRGKLGDVRAARLVAPVGVLDRTLVVIESQELLKGQKRGIAVALRKAKTELRKLARRVEAGKLKRSAAEERVKKALAREHLSEFVMVTVEGTEEAPTLSWRVDLERRRTLERTKLGRRILCTDNHAWSSERIAWAFRGQWHVEELFRRAKKGGIVPWGPSYQWSDASLRFHTFATVLGLMLVSLAKLALGTPLSVRATMESLAGIRATLVRTSTGARGRRPTALIPPELSSLQRKAVRLFELERWMPHILSASPTRAKRAVL